MPPSPVTTNQDCLPEDVVMIINHLLFTCASVASIKNWTLKDPVLSCILMGHQPKKNVVVWRCHAV